MTSMRGRIGVVVVALLASTVDVGVWQAAQLTPQQQREFLKNAEITGGRPIGRGVTGALRLTLSDGTITHDAAFQTIDDRTSAVDRVRGRRRAGELNFVDSYKYNIAAYELAGLLGVDHMMPVTVERRWQGKPGALTWWVDDVLMDENERQKTDTMPPSSLDFIKQQMTMTIFAELVGDVDRNKGNILYTRDWRLIMIDFTRAFRLHRDLREAAPLTRIERRLWERLQQTSRGQWSEALDKWLTSEELGALEGRRTSLIEHFTRLINTRGESVVLY